MGRRARKIRQAQKNSAKSKLKIAKAARFAAAQERNQMNKEDRSHKWRGIHRVAVRNRRKVGGTITLKTFDKIIRKMKNERS